MATTVVWPKTSPKLRDPILIEGLPGIGLVANIAVLHLIGQLKAKKFHEIGFPYFQPFLLTAGDGSTRQPVNELYCALTPSIGRDLILLWGNSQAADSRSQYELCRCVLDVAQMLGCRLVITLGGMRSEEVSSEPRIFCSATDRETLQSATGIGGEIMRGNIYGAAGVLVGLAGLRGMHGLSILAETAGQLADVVAARTALEFLGRYLGLQVDLSRLDRAAEANRKLLEAFLHAQPKESVWPDMRI